VVSAYTGILWRTGADSLTIGDRANHFHNIDPEWVPGRHVLLTIDQQTIDYLRLPGSRDQSKIALVETYAKHTGLVGRARAGPEAEYDGYLDLNCLTCCAQRGLARLALIAASATSDLHARAFAR